MATDASFGRWLSARRHLLDLTQDELARKVGCSVVTIRKLEADERRPSKQIAGRLAASLGIPEAERAAFLTFARSDAPTDVAEPSLPAAAPPAVQRPMLPTPLTTLVGREQDLAAIRNQLLREETRLLTLVGAPGIGKTRLSLAAAIEAQAAFANRVVFVALAPISDPELVVATIAQALGVKEVGDQPLLETLQAQLRDRQQLLILDNFEQVPAAAPQIAELLSTCPQVKVLVTSRAALRVRGERLAPVPPLLLPDVTQLPSTSDLAQNPSIALFVERAQAVQPVFQLSEANAAAVTAICTRLDGLPLAIELAAARVRIFSPQALLARLERRLNVLTGGQRDLPERHQTLRNTIDWSYALLNEDERALFRRLGVFVGGWTLEAAAVVCQGAAIPASAVDDMLATLADHHLVAMDTTADGEPRFTMLETIREYAVERLADSSEHETVRQRHVAYYHGLAQAAEPQLTGRQQIAWLDRLEQEHVNLQVALQWTLDQHKAETALQFCAALWRFWQFHSHHSVARRWMEATLEQSHLLRSTTRAKVLYGAGWLAHNQGDDVRARALFDESLALARQLEDSYTIAMALGGVAQFAMKRSDFAQARTLAEERLRLFTKLADSAEIAWSIELFGKIAWTEGDAHQAQACFTECLARLREVGQVWGTALLLSRLGTLMCVQGDLPQAIVRFQEALELYQDLGDKKHTIRTIRHLGEVAWLQGNTSRAVALFGRSLTLAQNLGDYLGIAWSLAALAGVATTQAHPERAVRLFGAAESLLDRLGVRLGRPERADWDRNEVAASAQLGQGRYDALWAEGRMMTVEQALAYALEDSIG